MHVVLLSLVFSPDNVSTAHVMADLTSDLTRFGHRVTVFTTTPHYNEDPGAQAAQPLRPLWGPLLQTSDYHGMRVYHAWMPRKGRSVVLRLLAWIWFHVVSTVAALMLARRPAVILVPSPPLTAGVSAWVLGRLRSAPFVYNVQEIYPDIAINLGALRNRAAIRLMYALEQFVYRRARAITVIAPRMRERLLEKGVPPAKIVVIPNFVDLGDLSPRPKDNPFSRAFGVHDKFVVSYAGNLGPAQGLECFVDVAALLREHRDVRLLLIGDGMLAEPLRARATAQGLSNLVVIPYQPYSAVPDIYGASDLCVVAQAATTGSDAIPSKVYRIMACERPVVAATDHRSDLAHLIRDADAGVVIPPESANALAEAVRDAIAAPDHWRRRAASGRAYVAAHNSRASISHQYEEMLREIAGER
ncbi:MAG: glycosyltransferase family 4 protein [Gemmatimonadota bacterium]